MLLVEDAVFRKPRLVRFQFCVARQMIGPFFLFQMLCCGIWLLDEYWQYSIVTAVMIVMLEVPA